ncbi:multivesicular body subunit 12B-like [Agrilus planipennis]|uniref:Multivesicular body subunit 12A n=1 Tax=Agrilus planipennis TaxID=224129 RepID=A0A1W4W7N3_AGRPL|nr:multivesicular body subunit 12B [Agrilus planipennis]XP_025829329.1 multivesicular body subunit 12B-like [Agrilus planipennis]
MLQHSQSNKIVNTLSSALPDDRPVTAIQIVNSADKCPLGFYPIIKTYDADQDADLWREGSFLKINKTARYLCLSKTEGIPGFVVQEVSIINEKAAPPEGYSLLYKTVDTDQKAWRKKQLCYKLASLNSTSSAVTDIIVCSRLKKAPEGFDLAGEINGVTICYKMGNVQDYQNPSSPANKNDINRRNTDNSKTSDVYPNLDDDHDYEILKPGYIPPVPSRAAPQPPLPAPYPPINSHQTLTNTMHQELAGVPFVLNPKFMTSYGKEAAQIPFITEKSLQQLEKQYNYNFSLERQAAT